MNDDPYGARGEQVHLETALVTITLPTADKIAAKVITRVHSFVLTYNNVITGLQSSHVDNHQWYTLTLSSGACVSPESPGERSQG